MDFSISADQLSKALRQCYDVANGARHSPVLTNILIKASGKDSVTFTSFDGRLAVTVEVSALVHKEGSALLPSKTVEFFTMLQGTIQLQREVSGLYRNILVRNVRQDEPATQPSTADGKKSRKKKGSQDSSLQAKFPEMTGLEDYPRLPEGPGEALMGQLHVGVMVEGLKRVEHAMSKDDARPTLEGVQLAMHGEKFRFVAVDGHRLAMLERKLGEFKLEKPLGIPIDAVVKLRSILESEAPDSTGWKFGANAQILCAQRTGLRIISLLLEGSFPEYERVIPDLTSLVTIQRVRFIEALTRVSLVCKGKEHSNVLVNFTAEGSVAVTASSPQIGEATDSLEVVKSGVEHGAKFNHRHLLEALEAAGGEEVQVGFSADHPALVKSTDGFLAVVMPRR